MKRIISLFLALMLIASLSITAFAAGEVGSITINGVGSSTTYEIYRLLDLESYDTASGAYSYKANAAWTAFLATTEAKKYLSTDESGYVTWIAAEDDDTVATFAKGALSYAKVNGISPIKSSKNAGQFSVTGTTGVFSNLPLGYYLVDSTMGALCGLTTTNPDASINAKNGIPTIDKQVKEDSTEQWGAHNTADIGQTLEYRVTINVHAGAENYVLHDTMGAGLKFQEVTKVEHVIPGKETHVANSSKYTVKTGSDVTDGCAFEIHFTKQFCDDLETNDKIIVYYTAMLTRFAETDETSGVNRNTAWLTFGEGGESEKDTVDTSTFEIDIVKTDSQNALIDGAKFRIYDAATGGNEVQVVYLKNADDTQYVLDSKGNLMYRRARADETGIEIEVKGGQVTIKGLDNGTYYLEETAAPSGYNKLTSRQKFIISDDNLKAIFNLEIYSTGSGVHVVNKTGNMLPETGAMGTMLFITLGTMMVLGAGVLLVTKKRMSMIED